MSPSDTAPAFPGLLEEMTAAEVSAFAPQVVVLPLGSTEPHGPHLPLGTDTFQVTRLCRLAVERANRQGAGALLYPTLPITNNANFRRFPFSLRIGIRTLMSVIVDIAAQCGEDGIRKVVIVNGHGGNPAAIDAALREIAGMDDMPFVCWTGGIAPEGFTDPIEHTSDHGGESETSRMMFAFPVPRSALEMAARLLGVKLSENDTEEIALKKERFTESLAISQPPARIVEVAKVRSQFEFEGGWVELADVIFPRFQTQTISIQSLQIEAVESMLDELEIDSQMEAMNYVEACRRWG